MLAAIFIVALGLATGSLTLVRSLPTTRLATQVTKASQLLMDEQPYDSPLSRALGFSFTNYPWSRDNGTDSTMLSVMLPQSGSALHSAMDNQWAQLTDPYQPRSYPQQAIPSLTARLTGMRPVQSESYARYWHGYQVITQPLLRVMSYAQTRVLNAVLLTLCLIATVIVIARFVSRTVALAFLVILALAGTYIVPLSWQFVAVSYLALVGIVAVVLLGRTREWSRFDLELFFILGIVTVFFDFLTIPLITLGLPLLMVLAMMWREHARHASFGKASRRETLRASSAWVGGYALFWFAKWAIASVLLKQNVIRNAIEQIFLRGGSQSGSASSMASNTTHSSLLSAIGMRIEAPLKNLAALIPGPATTTGLVVRGAIAVALIVLAFAIWFILRSKRRSKNVDRNPVGPASSFLIVAAFPLVWYFVLANHSIQNYYFTYRLLTITLFGVALFFICTLAPATDPGTATDTKTGADPDLSQQAESAPATKASRE